MLHPAITEAASGHLLSAEGLHQYHNTALFAVAAPFSHAQWSNSSAKP
jgi:hypothetical protein